ncbi:hypothetical protein [Oleiagrimonas soli]|uniref:HAMP domain-containing protein n=1 Tax=Oleiagrimonas soli TaxID=1543381 RepID=A0A099CVC5_9GAMM|nr:hypothetical protein [Oleiagrimonas soli]KGI77537.1 hypothetical protein LF63_0109390 [Oleiagrimonas soli]MBB6182993.1 hypothetical protein [Oleiagrimonas soli]
MTIATRYLAYGLLLVVALAAAAAAGVVWQFRAMAKDHLIQHYRQSSAMAISLQSSRMRELQLRAHTLAADPAFVDYVAQSLIPNPQLGGGIDSASISNLLDERRHRYDTAVVLGPNGDLVTRSGLPLRSNSNFRNDPLVEKTLRTHQPTSGLWSGHGSLARVAVEPLLRGDTLQGVLVAATRVKPRFVEHLTATAHTGVAIIVPSAQTGATVAVASGMDASTLQALTSNDLGLLASDLGNEHAASLPTAAGMASAWITPIGSSDGRAALVLLDANQASLDGWSIPPEAWPLLAGIALLGALAALAVLILHTRTFRPLDAMRGILERAASGETGITLRTGGNRSVRALCDTINRTLKRSRS